MTGRAVGTVEQKESRFEISVGDSTNGIGAEMVKPRLVVLGFDFRCGCGRMYVVAAAAVVVGGTGNTALRERGEVEVDVCGVSGKPECCESTGLRSRERRLLLLLLLLIPELRKERPKKREARLGRVGGD